MRAVAVLAGMGLVLAGCGPNESFGYIEVKRQVAPGPTDVFRLNGQALEELKIRTNIVVRQPAGKIRLDFMRGAIVQPLCDFDLGKNRIVTATIQVVENKLVCVKQL